MMPETYRPSGCFRFTSVLLFTLALGGAAMLACPFLDRFATAAAAASQAA
jgi:hypothetical protein